ncbi:MAG: hypothetical protein CMD35_06750 [Flavobacteriales bacterium]|nr:hypothetical protein [Flavobacteriales bacterium]|tara:strand:+ start:516 stop:1445 length:930 start_codon:yes stop_codon:yes gene_type:complete
MNKEVFNHLLKNPAHVDPKHKSDLKKLVDNFPYSANIRLLYLSSLLNDADVLFEQELKKTAAYISDRSVLKKIISKPLSKDAYIIEESKMKVLSGEDKSNENLECNQENIGKVNQKEIEGENTVEEKENKSEEITQEKKSSQEKEFNRSEKSKNQSLKELDDLIISSAIGASISLDIDKISTEIKEEVQEEGTKSFLEWIKASETKEIRSNLSPKEKERKEFREKAEVLIDQFILNQPKIKPKTEFYSPENMAKKSIEDSQAMVTETLARVYAEQGNMAKAKSIYEQLILKNPEKKSYFASLIKDLRSE